MPAITKLPDFDRVIPDEAARTTLIPWRCGREGCRGDGRWWLSAHGVVLCERCTPPSWPELAVRRGDASDAPLVHPDRSSTLPEHAADPIPVTVKARKSKSRKR